MIDAVEPNPPKPLGLLDLDRDRNDGLGSGLPAVDTAFPTADPSDPQMFNPVYDSGDHLHPNDAGYQAMANAINLSMLTS
jgi:lysophospholipase L1-like esterase